MAPKRPPFDDPPAAATSEEDETSRGEDEEASEEGASSEEKEENVDFKRKNHAPPPPSASDSDRKAASKKQDPSKKLFQRVWSERDEIMILKGIGRYAKKKGVDPSADMNDFHGFIKQSLHAEVSKSQLQDKIRRLRKKYQNNLRRGKKGEDPTFSKPQEQRAFALSKLVWGGKVETPVPEQRMAIGSGKESGRKPLKEEHVEKNYEMDAEGELAQSDCFNELLDFSKDAGVVGMQENVIRRGLELIEEPKKAELAAQWKQLHVAELELFVMRTELLRDQARLIMEAYKSSN